jgi:hypothetical protein
VAVNVTLPVVQLRLPDEVMPAIGSVLSCVTVTVALVLQPFVGSVTVTLYVLAAFTVSVCEVPPLLHI